MQSQTVTECQNRTLRDGGEDTPALCNWDLEKGSELLSFLSWTWIPPRPSPPLLFSCPFPFSLSLFFPFSTLPLLYLPPPLFIQKGTALSSKGRRNGLFWGQISVTVIWDHRFWLPQILCFSVVMLSWGFYSVLKKNSEPKHSLNMLVETSHNKVIFTAKPQNFCCGP